MFYFFLDFTTPPFFFSGIMGYLPGSDDVLGGETQFTFGFFSGTSNVGGTTENGPF
jgi:hypothetical protein